MQTSMHTREFSLSDRKNARLKNHRLGQLGMKHSGSSGPASQLEQGHPGEHCIGFSPDGSLISPGRESTQTPQQFIPVLGHPHNKEVLLDSAYKQFKQFL